MKESKKMTQKTTLLNKVKYLPEKPGIYLFIDNKNEILYIGKAKNLKKRVYSYFSKQITDNNKLKVLINKTTDINHFVVESESDALLLENNLIKKIQPRYNVNLKDDKTFPWICIKNEPFPRIFSTRTYTDDGSKYYGPYTSAVTVRTLLNLIKKLYPLRTCKLNLSESSLKKRKYKVCLEYHIGNCRGPCELLQTEADYDQSVIQINEILKGNLKELISYLENMMNEFSVQYNYEKAQEIKDKMETLKRFQLKSAIVNNKINNVDVLSIVDDNNSAWVNFLKVINGAVVQAYSVELNKKLNETKEFLLEFALTELRYRLKSNAREIILPFNIEHIPDGVKITVPIKGDKKKLLDLSLRNARFYMLAQKQQKEIIIEKKSSDRILLSLQKDLRLNCLPVHIECIDNSNIQGSSAVAACVVYKNGRPSKENYRHFHIKSVEGPNDTASMQEVVFRRYASLLKSEDSLPQLLIVDGGKPQLNAAVKSLDELNLLDKIAVIGIAKKLEQIFFPGDPVPLYINKSSESLKLIQQLRNEAHRFGIQFHRNQRSVKMLRSKLNAIKGIGEKSVELLIHSLKSYENIKNTDVDTLQKLIGKNKTKLLKEYFQGEDMV